MAVTLELTRWYPKRLGVPTGVKRNGVRHGQLLFVPTAALLLPSPGSRQPEFLRFLLFCRTFLSGGTRIRTGGTMIFRFVLKPTVHRHRAPWAESKRFLEVADPREPSANAVDRHTVVVGLW